MSVVAAAKHGRFGPLDAMRGIGALTVVVYHAGPFSTQVCGIANCNAPFGHLAVDMFFVLSGFVISYSYAPRFAAGMTFREFLLARVVRLYPIFFACVLLGCVAFIRFPASSLWTGGRLVVTVATNILMLPAPPYPAQHEPFPLISPGWSLFFELFVANVTYGLIRKRLTDQLLAWIVAIGLAVLIATVVFMGTINGGWLWSTFLVGFPRVLFAFYAGVAIHRLFLLRRPPEVPSILPLTLMALTFWPQLEGGWIPAYELLCVVVVYPALIYLGASARERIPQIGAAMGDVSYALYLVHIPLLSLALPLAVKHWGYVPQGSWPWSAFVLGSIFAAWLLNRLYDRPARRLFAKLISGFAR